MSLGEKSCLVVTIRAVCSRILITISVGLIVFRQFLIDIDDDIIMMTSLLTS